MSSASSEDSLTGMVAATGAEATDSRGRTRERSGKRNAVATTISTNNKTSCHDVMEISFLGFFITFLDDVSLLSNSPFVQTLDRSRATTLRSLYRSEGSLASIFC